MVSVGSMTFDVPSATAKNKITIKCSKGAFLLEAVIFRPLSTLKYVLNNITKLINQLINIKIRKLPIIIHHIKHYNNAKFQRGNFTSSMNKNREPRGREYFMTLVVHILLKRMNRNKYYKMIKCGSSIFTH
ncbi:hypothetical protein PPL_07439 [Heterostelium album PN500]|uniref:Uncharacterized protein n=1 Tax=Heterostelium pallidum (strain ATCC 26659 / Pp 5 / PN500) TaxID=670386 RepID=D3BFY8_HETP5|nr:hypothetical protein PPL_07439 [Heterostelium album PN500]EFA79748.1 hypothetical protein PPL_07439 [Heterostelium album PN500]|eukprot:XP_020431869.1 hypothetical protein PPL_07439 [Heterostelium album PN500]